MKKQMILGLLSLTAATSAFASGGQYMNCTTKDGNLVVAFSFDYEEGQSGSDTNMPVAQHLDGEVNLNDAKNQSIGALEPVTSAFYGYYRYETKTGQALPPKLHVSFKSDKGSVINIDASGPAQNGTGAQSAYFAPMTGKLTLIVREKGNKDEAALAKIGDLRSVDVDCQADTD